jgi:hypothetical protein
MMFGFLEGYTLERVGIVITPLFMLLTVFSGNAAHFHRPANLFMVGNRVEPDHAMPCCTI